MFKNRSSCVLRTVDTLATDFILSMNRECSIIVTLKNVRSASVSKMGMGEPLDSSALSTVAIPVPLFSASPRCFRRSPILAFLYRVVAILNDAMSSSLMLRSGPGKLSTVILSGCIVTVIGSRMV